MSFCSDCSNLLTVNSTADNLYNICIQCQKRFEIAPVNTLRFEETRGDDLAIYKTLFQYMAKDQTNPIVKKDCKCGHHLVRQMRMGTDMRLINACMKCGDKWLEGAA